MLLNIDNLDCLLRENGIKESQLENTREHIFNILKSAERDKHGRIKSIAIPKDKEYLFWCIVNEFEKIQYEWGNKDLSRAQLSSPYLNDIITGNSSFMHNHSEENGKKYLLLKDKSKPEGFCRLEIPQDISITYKLHFHFFSRKKEIVVIRYPAIKKTYEPKYNDGVLTIARKKLNGIEPRLMALYVLFSEFADGIKKEELESKYNRYKKIYDEILSIRSYDQEYQCPSKEMLINNLTKYISDLNTYFENHEIIPLYNIRQYKCKNRGEKYFLSINFINSDMVQRK